MPDVNTYGRLGVADGDRLAIDELVAGVLRHAQETVKPLRSPSESWTILRVAHVFADALERTGLPFDRVCFITAAAERRNDSPIPRAYS